MNQIESASPPRIKYTGGKRFLDAQAAPGEVIYSEPLPVALYGGAAITLLASAGVVGILTIEGSMDLCASWSHVFVGPLRVLPDEGPQTVNFSTLDPEGGHSGCTHYRATFQALPSDPRVEVVHISGNGQEYRDHPSLLPSGQLGPVARLKRWASKLRSR